MQHEHDEPGFMGRHQEGQTVEIQATDSVAIVSGGLDSTVLVYHMLDQGYTPHLLSFNYGQRHNKELYFAKATANHLNLPHDVVDLRGLTGLISNSALTSQVNLDNQIEVPEGHYAEDNMKATVVPNRNMIMLAIAAGVAVNEGARVVGLGVHGGDHFVYPDCRPMFISAMEMAILQGNEGFHNFDGTLKQKSKPEGFEATLERNIAEKSFFGESEASEHPINLSGPLYAPFLHRTKADIAYKAIELGVPFHSTWSCYNGGINHCGKCGTCVERLEAIDEAVTRWNNEDPEHSASTLQIDATEYDDYNFWREAVANA